MISEYDTCYICTHYLSAIINDDWSGLDIDDTVLLEDWLDDLPDYIIFDYADGEPSFLIDAVSGLRADCIAVTIMYQGSICQSCATPNPNPVPSNCSHCHAHLEV